MLSQKLLRFLNFPTTTKFFCSDMPKLVNVSEKDGIYFISINRPERKNCVSHATALQLIEAFENFDKNENANIAIWYGGTFCAGYDLSEVSSGNFPSGREAQEFLAKYRFMGPSMMSPTKPVIGAIEGYAVAGGLEMSLLCDLRVAAENAQFGVLCRRFGVPLLDGGTIRLAPIIGFGRAMDLILTGRPIDAKTGYEWGLVNRLAKPGKALEAAIELAKEIMQHPQACMRVDRQSAYFAAFDSGGCMQTAFNYELENGLPVLGEAQKGATNFVKKTFDKKIGENKL